MLIPGFLAGDESLGHHGALAQEHGPPPQPRGHPRQHRVLRNDRSSDWRQRLERLVERQGQRAAIVGHSRGGGLRQGARPAAARPGVRDRAAGLPDRRPARGPPVRAACSSGRSPRLGRLGVPGLFSETCLEGDCCSGFWEHFAADLPRGVGYVSIYSRTDGIVRWEACLDPAAVTVEVEASHCGMAVHADVFRALADALARLPPARRPAQAAAQGRLGHRASPRGLASQRSADRAPAVAGPCRTEPTRGCPPSARRTDAAHPPRAGRARASRMRPRRRHE